MDLTIQKTDSAEIVALKIRLLDLEKQVSKTSVAEGVTLKVSEKGAVSLRGIGKFPATFYASQWEVILDNAENIRTFIQANAHLLAVKPTKAVTTTAVSAPASA